MPHSKPTTLLSGLAVGLTSLLLIGTVRYHLQRWPHSHRDAAALLTTPTAGTATAQAAAGRYQGLADLHLFGAPVATTAAETPEGVAAGQSLDKLPPTSIAVQLFGIAFAQDPARAYAIVQTPEGIQRKFRSGERISDEVMVYAIQEHQIVIKNKDRLEAVTLPRQGEALLPQGPAALELLAPGAVRAEPLPLQAPTLAPPDLGPNT